MGNVPSRNEVQDNIEVIQENILRCARDYSEAAFVSFEEVNKFIQELNLLSESFMDSEGKQMKFIMVKGGENITFLWKGNLKINCIKYDPETKKIEKIRTMNVNQFLRVYKSIKTHLDTISDQAEQEEGATGGTVLNSSIILKELDLPVSSECCICFERPQEILLPCLHSFCEQCILQWESNNQTCPICREEMGSEEDSWVLCSTPKVFEIGEEVASSLMDVIEANSTNSS